jgi:predicted house-cleaning NTP pyrophosphatase (Maf/HAM1 superfamily)
MAKITRYGGNLKAFAADATGTERTVFGDVTQSDTLADNINADWFRGWGIVGVNEAPTKQDFNGMAFALGQLIAYLHQTGVPEWHTSQEYHIDSLTNRNGVLYFSLINDNIGDDPELTLGTSWAYLSAANLGYDNTTSGLVAETVQAAIDELDGRVDTLENDVSVMWQQAQLIGSGLAIATVDTPALAALNSTDVAFIDTTNDELRTYRWDGSTWSLVGSGLAITGVVAPAIAALNSTDVAYIDANNDELRVYRFDGTNWAQVGTGLTIVDNTTPRLAALSSTDVAYISLTGPGLRTYRFNGSTWSLVGSELVITGISTQAITALNSTDIAFIDGGNDELRTYRFNGSTWSLVGSGLSIPMNPASGGPALAALNSTDVAFVDGDNDSLRTYRWNGSTWSLIGLGLTITGTVSPALAALTGSDVAFIDDGNDSLRTYRFDHYHGSGPYRP